MNRPARTVLVTLVVAATAAWAAGCAPRPIDVPFPAYQPPATAPTGDFKGAAVGMSGCLATGCHGGSAAKALEETPDEFAWMSSGSVWVAADPHSAAYSLLTENPHRTPKVTAADIMRNYAPDKKAHEDARCLACHTNPALAEPGPTADPHVLGLRNEGVSCEACHGNAGGWVNSHTTWKGKRDDAVYKAAGMAVLDDIGARAMNCLGCHVGAPADPARGLPVRDMNHDMIAAGHPRLNFDFAEYLRRLPPHWQEKDRSGSVPVAHGLNSAKAWLVGRAAHAEAACKLLASRADRSATDPKTPWPEFAEFNCASCHHNLRVGTKDDRNWRQNAANLDGRPPGATPWQMIWPMTPAAGLPGPARADAALKELLVAMEKPRLVSAATAKAAVVALGDLEARRKAFVGLPDAEAVRQVRGWLHPNGRGPDATVSEWDSATQLYFGMAALERTYGANRNAVPPAFGKAWGALRVKNWGESAKWLGDIRTIQQQRP